jgi:hypothetical protein
MWKSGVGWERMCACKHMLAVFMPTLFAYGSYAQERFRVHRASRPPRTSTPAQSCHPLVEVSLAVFSSMFRGHLRMKKPTPNPPESPMDSGSFDANNPRLRNPRHPDPISHLFTILPDIDTPTLLCHACETLASLNVLTTDLAAELQGSPRSLALSIQQLAVLGELLVNRALDNLDPPAATQH